MLVCLVEMLIRGTNYGPEVVVVLKASLTACTPMLPPVVVVVHVPLRIRESVVPIVAGLAIILCAVVSLYLLVFIEVIFVPVAVIAKVTFPDVTDCLHVLLCSMPTSEPFVTFAALRHRCSCTS